MCVLHTDTANAAAAAAATDETSSAATSAAAAVVVAGSTGFPHYFNTGKYMQDYHKMFASTSEHQRHFHQHYSSRSCIPSGILKLYDERVR